MDLFEQYETLPQNVQDVLTKYEDSDETYDNCRAMLTDMEAIGYTFEYYLDACPFNLRRMFIKGQEYTYAEIENMTEDVGLNEADYEKTESGKYVCGSFIVTLEHKEKDLVITFVLVGIHAGQTIFECVYTDIDK